MDDETISAAEQLVTDLEWQPKLLPPAGSAKVEYVRDLTEADLAAPRAPTPPRALLRIHASHHAVARCLATGIKQNQVALVTGYTPMRISFLLQDPTFQALVNDYRTEAKAVFADLAERMTEMSLDAMELLQEKLHDNPAEFTIPALIEIIKTFADRTGHGPNQTVSVSLNRDLIDRPPRESHEEWLARRAAELQPPPKSLN